ncbi:hypothetical protein [Bradyrhizobium sp. S3.2.6]|uniref:hypothetical protein n=1 Tax=Bradyrhizobium sp. S3.2.6 TaxID=3156428 RepID=UPI003396985B
MNSPPRIWLDYRPVRIGWVVSEPDISVLGEMASLNACLWGGRFNCVIPAYDAELANRLVSCFAVDVLLPVCPDERNKGFIDRFPHLEHHRWSDSIFSQRDCEFADIRHVLRRLTKQRDREIEKNICFPSWDVNDPLSVFFATQLGKYPTPNADIPDYRAAIQNVFGAPDNQINPDQELPSTLLEKISPLALTGYDTTHSRNRAGWLAPGIVLGSVEDFDALAMFWNLRAAGAPMIFYDQNHGLRLKAYANAFLERFRKPTLESELHVALWTRKEIPRDDSWKPDLDLEEVEVVVSDGRNSMLWNGMNIRPHRPRFSLLHRDVVPAYFEGDGKSDASFALPGRPFDDGDVHSLRQKYAVVVDATRYGGPDAELTFETPFISRLNEFYGRNFHFEYDAARSQLGRLDGGAVAFITSVSTQQLRISAFHVFDWMKSFFTLCGVEIERSEAGLHASRLIAQLGGVQDCRVLKIRGVRNLLRKFGVDQSFTRSGAIESIRDVDPGTGAVGFDAFNRLHIAYREKADMSPDDVLRYLLMRRVFRAGLEFVCPNCRLSHWTHLDEVKTISLCPYCDHGYDVTPQLRDRDWRYRRSGIFGRNDDQLGGVPVAVTLQQLATALHEGALMYSTGINFRPKGAEIEVCEADFVVVVAGNLGIEEAPVQVVFGEAKTEGAIDQQDIRKLCKLADAVPREIASAYILLSKTGTFSPDEIALAKTLNTDYRRRVILWSRDELEPYHVYERSKEKLGDNWHAVSLSDMARITRHLYFG